jgi:hypothetical protein
MGLGPFASISNISIIEGNASLGGHIMAARVKASDKYDYKVKKWEKDGCTIEFFEDGESIGVSTFDKDDANAAGLLNKHNWKAYPRNMYFNRAVSNGVRTYCPDVLGNAPVYDPDELGATVNEIGTVTQVPANALPAITENADSDIQEPEVVEDDTDQGSFTEANKIAEKMDDVAEVTDEEIEKLETPSPESEDEPQIKKPDFGDKPGSNLPKPTQRKFLKSIANESDINRASMMVLDKSVPATFTDFNTVIDFIMTGEMPEQTSLIGDDNGSNNKE